jgi:hypothetical protein
MMIMKSHSDSAQDSMLRAAATLPCKYMYMKHTDTTSSEMLEHVPENAVLSHV